MDVKVEVPMKPVEELCEGDIVVHNDGIVHVVVRPYGCPIGKFGVANITTGAATGPESYLTSDGWFAHWRRILCGFEVYKPSEFELVLRRKGSC